MNHSTGDIGESVVATGMAEGESLVVEAKQMQHGGMQVMDVHLIFDRSKSEVIGGSVSLTATYTATGEPHGEAPVVVVSAITTFTG